MHRRSNHDCLLPCVRFAVGGRAKLRGTQPFSTSTLKGAATWVGGQRYSPLRISWRPANGWSGRRAATLYGCPLTCSKSCSSEWHVCTHWRECRWGFLGRDGRCEHPWLLGGLTRLDPGPGMLLHCGSHAAGGCQWRNPTSITPSVLPLLAPSSHPPPALPGPRHTVSWSLPRPCKWLLCGCRPLGADWTRY
jgi:hypothetical protein